VCKQSVNGKGYPHAVGAGDGNGAAVGSLERTLPVQPADENPVLPCMKTCITSLLLAGLFSAAFNAQVFAQGTAFTYQGRLYDGANPADGIYDLRFISGRASGR
jgi:hypothetical protein